jgi:hypothetical protein
MPMPMPIPTPTTPENKDTPKSTTISFFNLIPQILQHYIHQLLNSYPRLPIPITPSLTIINTIRPRICKLLSMIWLITHNQRHPLIYHNRQLLNRKTYTSHIITCPHLNILTISLH